MVYCCFNHIIGYPWLVGGLEHEFYDFPYIGNVQQNVIIPTDELIFFRGVAQPPTSEWCFHILFDGFHGQLKLNGLDELNCKLVSSWLLELKLVVEFEIDPPWQETGNLCSLVITLVLLLTIAGCSSQGVCKNDPGSIVSKLWTVGSMVPVLSHKGIMKGVQYYPARVCFFGEVLKIWHGPISR